MIVTFYKSQNGDWEELYIEGKKYYGGHSLPAEWCAKYISKALRNNPIGVNTLTVITKYFMYDEDICSCTVVGTNDAPEDLGASHQEDF